MSSDTYVPRPLPPPPAPSAPSCPRVHACTHTVSRCFWTSLCRLVGLCPPLFCLLKGLMTCVCPCPPQPDFLLQSIYRPSLGLQDPLLFVFLSPTMAWSHRGQLGPQISSPSSPASSSPSPSLLPSPTSSPHPAPPYWWLCLGLLQTFFQIDFGFLA